MAGEAHPPTMLLKLMVQTYMPDFAKTLGGHGVLSSLDDL